MDRAGQDDVKRVQPGLISTPPTLWCSFYLQVAGTVVLIGSCSSHQDPWRQLALRRPCRCFMFFRLGRRCWLMRLALTTAAATALVDRGRNAPATLVGISRRTVLCVSSVDVVYSR